MARASRPHYPACFTYFIYFKLKMSSSPFKFNQIIKLFFFLLFVDCFDTAAVKFMNGTLKMKRTKPIYYVSK